MSLLPNCVTFFMFTIFSNPEAISRLFLSHCVFFRIIFRFCLLWPIDVFLGFSRDVLVKYKFMVM